VGGIERGIGGVELQVVGDIEIEVAVEIQIPERRPHAPARIGDAGRLADVGEAPAAVVAKQLIVAEPGQQQVLVAVAIDIAERHAAAPDPLRNPGARGGVFEFQAAAAQVEPALLRPPAAALQAAAAGQEQIKPAVAVGVEQGQSGAVGLENQILVGVAAARDEVEPAAGGRVLKSDWTVRSRTVSLGCRALRCARDGARSCE
jgi:hypothetical protein